MLPLPRTVARRTGEPVRWESVVAGLHFVLRTRMLLGAILLDLVAVLLGDAIARLYEAAGFHVTREYYFNNGGRQMRLLGESVRVRYLQELGREATLPEDGYQGEYVAELAAEIPNAAERTPEDLGVAGGALDVVRSQAVGLDEFIARWVGRLRPRRYSGPPGPPDGHHPPASLDGQGPAGAPRGLRAAGT